MIKIILLTIFGSAINRWRGSDDKSRKYAPHPIPQILLSFPFAYASYAVSWQAAAIVLVLTVIAFVLGHGQYFPQMMAKKIKPERIDFLVKLFFSDDPRTKDFPMNLQKTKQNERAYYDRLINDYGRDKLSWRCFTGMALTGLAVTLPAGVVTFNPLLAISGILKAPSYVIAMKIKPDDGDKAIEYAEYITGAILYFILALYIF